jgi:hypothetical protein
VTDLFLVFRLTTTGQLHVVGLASQVLTPRSDQDSQKPNKKLVPAKQPIAARLAVKRSASSKIVNASGSSPGRVGWT